MFRSLKMLICSTCAVLYVLKRMNWDPEYRKDRMWQNRIKISLLNIWTSSVASRVLQKSLTYHFHPHEFPQCYPQRLKQREFNQKQTKRPSRGSRKGKKKKREGPVSIRKFAHPNLCTLGGAVCKLLQVPLQGMRLLGEPPGFRGKRWRKGSSRIKQSFLSAKETFPLTSRHLGSSQHLGAERPTALFLFWQHYSEWA